MLWWFSDVGEDLGVGTSAPREGLEEAARGAVAGT